MHMQATQKVMLASKPLNFQTLRLFWLLWMIVIKIFTLFLIPEGWARDSC